MPDPPKNEAEYWAGPGAEILKPLPEMKCLPAETFAALVAVAEAAEKYLHEQRNAPSGYYTPTAELSAALAAWRAEQPTE